MSVFTRGPYGRLAVVINTLSSITSIVPYHALHVPQHVAVSLSEPLNLMISSAPSTETVFGYLDQAYPDTQVLFWNYLFLDELLATAEGHPLHPNLTPDVLTCVLPLGTVG